MNKKIIIIIFLLLLIILGVLITLLVIYDNTDNTNIAEASIVSEPKTVEDVIKKYNSEYIEEKNSTIYVIFNKDLFNEDGSSNESFFNNIISDIKPFYKMNSFSIVDEEKNININVRYNVEKEDYVITINNIEDFFKNVNGKSYVDVDKTTLSELSNINTKNEVLAQLELNSTYFDSIQDMLGEGKELENGYTSYLNGTVKVRLSPIKTVRNIIFSKDYEGDFSSSLKFGASLREIYADNSSNAFGSVEEGYLGYINDDFYMFFYNDETSLYSYSYKYNKDFEDLLEEYLQSKDLDKFITRLLNKWKVYDYYEYNPETENAYVLYSNRGIEIDIKNNDSKGITLYKNYYFGERAKQFVKDGLVTLNSNTDLLDKVEKERRNNR